MSGKMSPINSPEHSGAPSESESTPAPAPAPAPAAPSTNVPPVATSKSFHKPEPAAKKPKETLIFRETQGIGAVTSLDDMEPKVLRFQNKKLAERLTHYQTTTDELRNRNEQLQQRLATTDAEIFIINRHMKNLDENVRLLIKRFETECLGEGETENPRSPLDKFLLQLSALDEDELDKTLSGRVQDMRNLVGKLIQVYETVWNQSRSALEKMKNNESVDEERQAAIDQMLKKNERLEQEKLQMHERHISLSLENSKLKDRVAELETERDELKNKEADLSWSLDKEQSRREKTENMVVELRQKSSVMETQLESMRKEGKVISVSVSNTASNMSSSQMGDLVTDLEDQKSLASGRLVEVNKLHAEKVALEVEIDNLKVKVQSPPDEVVINSPKYKSLQTHFSVLFVEHEKLKEYYKTAREAVQTMRSSYLQQLKEAQRHEEEGSQMFQAFLTNLQTATNAARGDYQRLKIEFEQERASRETGGTSKDYDKLFKLMMQQSASKDSELQRLKKRANALTLELNKLQSRDPSRPKGLTPEKRTSEGDIKSHEGEHSKPLLTSQTSQPDSLESLDGRESSTMKDLRKQLRDKTKEYDELKLLYDITKQASKSNRELIEIMASERKLKDEIAELRRNASTAEDRVQAAESNYKVILETMESLKSRNRQLEEKVQELEKEKAERQKNSSDDEASRKIRVLEDNLSAMRRILMNHKEQEEAMMNEMEITGQALEELQNQNKALIDQLKEKDNTTLKWMSDNIRNGQIIRTLKDEKNAQETRYRTTLETIQKYEKQLTLAEERIKLLEEANENLEEDRKSSEYVAEIAKKRTFDQTKEANDLRLKLEQLETEFKYARTVHADKLKAYEGDVYKTRRLIEENAELKRKLERTKLMEVTGTSEEILKEDLREYKELLNCGSCKAARKDTVLTKCFHVFCNSCITKRYETRQRRCPQCATPFGANDYRRLFLT